VERTRRPMDPKIGPDLSARAANKARRRFDESSRRVGHKAEVPEHHGAEVLCGDGALEGDGPRARTPRASTIGRCARAAGTIKTGGGFHSPYYTESIARAAFREDDLYDPTRAHEARPSTSGA